jgi:hypothetical protein
MQELEQEALSLQQTMQEFETGRLLAETSQVMTQQAEMQDLMMELANQSIPDNVRSAIAGYMRQLLEMDPMNGLQRFINYVNELAEMPEYAPIKDYFIGVGELSDKLLKTQQYQRYIQSYQAFMADNSEQAVAAREKLQAYAKKMNEMLAGEQAS